MYKDSLVEKATERQSRLLIALVSLLCAIVLVAPLVAGRLFPIPSLSIQILVFIAALLWVMRGGREGLLRLPDRWITYPLAAFAILLVASAFGSASLHDTIRELANIASYLLVFLMIVSFRGNKPVVYGILASLMTSALVVGVLGIKEYILAPHAGWRVFSTFFNPDFLAGFMALILPVALAWYISRTSLGFSIALGIAVFLCLSSILLSASRFGVLTAAGGVAVFLALALLSRSLKKSHLLRLALLIPMLALIYLSMGKPLAGRISSTKAESHSGGFRIYTWKGTARMAAANPINGTGLGTFEIVYPKYAMVGYTKLAHNSYLQLAAEAGPLAAVALVVLLGASALPIAVMILRKQTPKDQDSENWMPETGFIASGLLGGAAASMARNLVDSDWYITAIGLSFWAILGTAIALFGAGRIVQVTPRRLAVFSGFIGLAALGLVIMLVAELSVAWGNILWAQQPDVAISRYHLAAGLDPLNAEFRRRLGSAYMSLAQATGDPIYADQAAGQLKQAIRLEPMRATNYYKLGRVYEFYPKNQEAIKCFTAALDRHPNAPEVMYALANRYEASGRPDEALKVWTQMVALEDTPFERVRAVPEMVEPEFIFAHIGLGQDLERRGDRSGAEKEYRLALDRAVRYQECTEAMREVLEINNRRDLEMESQVEQARREISLLLAFPIL